MEADIGSILKQLECTVRDYIIMACVFTTDMMGEVDHEASIRIR